MKPRLSQNRGIIKAILDLKQEIWQNSFKNLEECYLYLSKRISHLFLEDELLFWLPRIILLAYDQILIDCMESATSETDYWQKLESLRLITPFFEDNFNYYRVTFEVVHQVESPNVQASTTTVLHPTIAAEDITSFSSGVPSSKETKLTQPLSSPGEIRLSLTPPSDTAVYTPQKYQPEKELLCLPPAIDV